MSILSIIKIPTFLESNDRSCESNMPIVDSSLQHPVPGFSEQRPEVAVMDRISTKTNSESSEPIADSSCIRKKKTRCKTQEINDESCGNDKRCDLSVGFSLEENTMPGIDPSQQLSVLEFSEQNLELPQQCMEGFSTTSSESPESHSDLSCSQKRKKKRGRKTHESNDRSCDPSVGSSLVEKIVRGADPSLQPPVAILSEQELEVPQLLLGESTFQEMNDDKEQNERSNASGNNDTDHEFRAGLRGQVVIDVKSYETFYDNSLSDALELGPTDIKESSDMLEEQNGLSRIADGGSRNKVDTEIDCVSQEWGNIKTYMRHDEVQNSCRKVDKSCNPDDDLGCFEENGVKGTSLHCSVASHEAEDFADTDRMKTKIEVPSFPPLAIKSDVDVTTIVKEGNLLQISKAPPERSLVSCSKKKLLILDVNGLLADIVPQEDVVSKRYRPDIIISGKAVFKRPFCIDFLQFCFNKFNVGVWSSRTKKNVDMVIDFILGDSKRKLLFCWDQSHCTATRFNTIGNNNKPLVLKELRKLWEKADDPHLPWVRGEYNESNTLLLDDSPYKALRNPVNTAIFPYSYHFKDRKDTSLGGGGEIRFYLEGLAVADNVQEYVEQHPFGQRPITKSSASWDFYRRVIEDDRESHKDTNTSVGQQSCSS